MTLCWDVDFCLWLFCCGRSTKLQPDKETCSTDVEIRDEMSGGGLKVSAETETVIFSKFDIRYLLQNFFFFPLKLFVSTTKPQKQKLVLHKQFKVRDRSPLVLGCEVGRYGGLERPIRRGTQF